MILVPREHRALIMIGVGVDLVEIARIRKAHEANPKRFSEKVLNAAELVGFGEARDSSVYLAKRFAVKEAVAKALGTGFSQGVSWQDITLDHNELGKPYVDLTGGAAKRFAVLKADKLLISLSDEAGLVMAYAHIS